METEEANMEKLFLVGFEVIFVAFDDHKSDDLWSFTYKTCSLLKIDVFSIMSPIKSTLINFESSKSCTVF